jgi:hypothetical protein
LLRIIVELSNAGRDDLARRVAAACGLQATGMAAAATMEPLLRRGLQAFARRLGLSNRTRSAVDVEARMVALVNAGHYAVATPLAEDLNRGRYAKIPRSLNERQQATLFALAVLDARVDDHWPRARQRFAAVRAACEAARPAALPPLFWSALQGEERMVAALESPACAKQLRDTILRRLQHVDRADG